MSGTPETDAAVMAAGGDWSYPLRECSRRLERERDEARAMAKDMAAQFWQAESKAERYCQERDKAQAALMKIEDLFVDGTDIYADRENMGLIAIAALEGEK